MRDPSDNTTVLERCGCPFCRRAGALDAMRHNEAARASRVPVVADPWPEAERGPPDLRVLALGATLSVAVELAILAAFARLWGWL